MIPDGPLHATDLGVALLLGVTVAVVFWRSRWWLPVASMSAVGGFGTRHGWDGLADGLLDRPNSVLALTALVATGTIGWQLDRRLAPGGLVLPLLTVAALVVVWGLVPDTEAPLMFGATLGGALIACPNREPAVIPGGAVLSLVVVAACVGTIGRPDRLLPVIVAIGLLVLLALGATLAARSFSEQDGRPARRLVRSGRGPRSHRFLILTSAPRPFGS